MMPDEEMKRLRARLAREYPLVDRSVAIGGRGWIVTAARDQDALLDRVQTDAELERFPYGLLLWASAIGLAERLAEEPGLVAGRRVLEIGAGTGLPGIVAQSLGGAVTQTDYQSDVLSLARVNAWQNGIGGIRHLLADWRRFPDPVACDVLIGSDVLYERALHHDLERILARVVDRGGLALISDPLRPQSMEFADRMEREGWRIELEGWRVDWEEDAREIALFRLQREAGHEKTGRG